MGESDFVSIRGSRVLLRDPRPEDVDARVRWRTVETAWGDWDAPWEGNKPVAPEKVDELRRLLRAAINETLPLPRKRLWIERIGGPLLGWVNHYHHDPDERTTWVGIDICESGFWGQGLGAEALKLWADYLFAELDLTSVQMGTWSGNGRMIRCAEKCGFVLVKREVGVREVRGERYDRMEFRLRGGGIDRGLTRPNADRTRFWWRRLPVCE